MSAVILDSICCNIYVVHHHIKSFTHQKKRCKVSLATGRCVVKENLSILYLKSKDAYTKILLKLYDLLDEWTEAHSNKQIVINTLRTKSTLSSALEELLYTKVPLLVIDCQGELPTRITAQLTLKNIKTWKRIHFLYPLYRSNRTLFVGICIMSWTN